MMLSEALHIIDHSTEPFSIKVVKYNETTKQGGDFLTLNCCIKAENFQRKNSGALGAKRVFNKDPNAIYKNPNHYQNATRNLLLLQKVANTHTSTGNFRKIHIWLITELNGQKVKM